MRLHRLAGVGAALPCVAVFALLAASGFSVLALGRPLVWPARDLTLPEAVAMRDLGETVRLLTSGADPNAAADVDDVFRPGSSQLTPLEAAVLTRERYMVEVVLDYGGRVDAQTSPTLQCLARATGAEDLASLVAERSQPIATCDGVVLPWQP